MRRIADLGIRGVTCDSKAVKKNFLFVAIKGNLQDGSCFIKEAIANGASYIIAQGKPRASVKAARNVKFISVRDARKFLGQACAEFYQNPSRKVKVIGITGTNGKTTISYLIEAIARQAKYGCGVIGTISHRFKNKVIIAKNTTPGSGQLQELLSKMRSARIKYCAMEVSSHALDQERVEGIDFTYAIFTNLTLDHLDYHKNLENYFQAKAKLFRKLSSASVGIINNDDPVARRLKTLTCAKVLTYGIKNKSDFMAHDIQYSIKGSEFVLAGPGVKAKIYSNLVGRHNIYNLLAAIAWGVSENITFKDIKSALKNFKNIPGRLEKVFNKKGYNVFVDYAHTPDALFNIISAMRPLVKKKIIVIFGCGGQRDKLKRPLMGELVTRLADYAIVTSDNPRSEDPLLIIRDICKGISKKNFRVIPDRLLAIKEGLALIGKDDCLVIAGKGHENYQVFKNKVQYFNDYKAAQKCLQLKK
ncbi:MAG: UDP-N-acetylmuramoyl-L-alanyl-D-glutamate--2,6-diaminopimelate ligase [Candidatus Omnitrophota bacterium]|nr:UDP-N-acetylmuramoyl-L-alanyl-D-glutamate--2,6-diaminopimelate ligase [Candidatus Omnitrophota bacterium]